MKKKIIILGSTGSIGKNTFKLIKKDKKNFDIKVLSTNKNIKLVIKQAKEFKVNHIIINDYNKFLQAKKKYNKYRIKFYNSFDVLDKILKKKEIFYSMVSIVGIDGLNPTLKLIEKSKNIAVINKEALICGWGLLKKKLDRYNTNFIPVDSEHFSIFMMLQDSINIDIDEVILTASGGPFLKKKNKNFKSITINEALNHPNWKMGKKISIDSSTMMNKVFEVIEAKHIFNLKYKQIRILIHPKSYIHAIIKYTNGINKILAHDQDMKIPIYNSIYLSEKKKFFSKKLDLKVLNDLQLAHVDKKKFPLVQIIKLLPNYNSLYETAIVVINDFFVSKFLDNRISYFHMINMIKKYSFSKSILKLRSFKVKKVDDIYQIRNNVSLKLLKLEI